MQSLVNEASVATPNGAGKVIGPDSFLTLHYRIALENDTDIVTTFDDRPTTLLLGRGQMAPVLERALLGIRKGERTTFRLAPEHAFGPRSPKLLQRMPLATLRESLLFGEGYQPDDLVEFNTPNGDKYADVLREVGKTSALFDFNHPLAGQTIVFEVRLIGIL